ncbi:MAG: isocitrate lyase/phosphoenolpyruvate mutase family protein [Bacillota bacterium]|nr:isocitrate lyase/phosphoenolpyruvate mutase family protein [Bacillota bacterium]
MHKDKQIKLADSFRKMHQNEDMLVLPNCWNGGSAKIFENIGFKALGTTSAGIAYSKGFPDGENINMDDLIRVTEEIVRVVDIPLTVDIERGYSETLEGIKENVRRIIEAGAVGINIEDGHYLEKPYIDNLDEQLKKIRALDELREEMDIPFFINARSCVYWLNIGSEKEKFETALERGNAFASEGADCVFLPGAIDENTVKKLVEGIKSPINIIANPLFFDIDRLTEIGVKRLSIGSGAARTVFGHLISIGEELKYEKSIKKILNNDFSYDKADKFFR